MVIGKGFGNACLYLSGIHLCTLVSGRISPLAFGITNPILKGVDNISTPAGMVGAHGAVIGRYERDEVKPSIEMATQIAEALNVSLDYLVGSTDLLLDKGIIKKIQEIQQLDTENKNHLFALMDAFLRDYKAKQAYSS